MLSSYPTHSHIAQDKPATLTCRRKVSPLDIPEILENILSHIRGSTLTRTSILVCRQWFLMVRHRLIRQTDWDSTWPSEELDKVLMRIPTTTRLRCFFAKPTRVADTGDDNARKLWKILKDHHLKYRKHRRQPPHHRDPQRKKQQSGVDEPFSPGVAAALETMTLRDLVVEGYVCHHTILPHGLSGLSSLRVLKIHTKQEATFYMSSILGALPELEVLHIRSICALDLSEPWIQSIGDRYSKRLRSLVLVNALVHQSSLEDLLSASPCLKELQLMVCRFPGRNVPGFEMKRFYDFCQSSLADLEVFQFGNDSIVPVDNDSAEEDEVNEEWRAELVLMLSGCLKSKNWTFFGHKLPSSTIESLFSIPNRVTTLEILGPCDTLHNFLCESPQLLHVKAPWTTIQPHHMDLHLCWDHGDGRMIDFGCSTLSNAPKIWACRGLQTLHIGARFYDRYVPGYNDYSLYLFGYIAKVCPMLQDLALFGPESKPTSRGSLSTSDTFRLDLAGGFCLLSHLTHLQYLRIGELYVDPFVKPIDVDWMLRSGHSAEKKQERAEVIARWSSRILQDRELQKQGKQPYEPQLSGLPLEILGLEPELKKDLRYVGHKMDVIETLAGMDEQEGFVCWAELDRISIYGQSGFGQSLEEEVGRLVAPPAFATRSLPPRPQGRFKGLFQKIKANFSEK